MYLAGSERGTAGLCRDCLTAVVLDGKHIELALVAMRDVLARDAMSMVVRIARGETLDAMI